MLLKFLQLDAIIQIKRTLSGNGQPLCRLVIRNDRLSCELLGGHFLCRYVKIVQLI